MAETVFARQKNAYWIASRAITIYWGFPAPCVVVSSPVAARLIPKSRTLLSRAARAFEGRKINDYRTSFFATAFHEAASPSPEILCKNGEAVTMKRAFLFFV